MTTESDTRAYMTARQACDRLGYSRPDSPLRAWHARGLPLYRPPGGTTFPEGGIPRLCPCFLSAMSERSRTAPARGWPGR
jgi:hypothetical protein